MRSGTATDNQTAQADAELSPARQIFDYLGRRLGWPEDVAEACAALEERYPAFSLYYAHPLLPRYGRTG